MTAVVHTPERGWRGKHHRDGGGLGGVEQKVRRASKWDLLQALHKSAALFTRACGVLACIWLEFSHRLSQ